VQNAKQWRKYKLTPRIITHQLIECYKRDQISILASIQYENRKYHQRSIDIKVIDDNSFRGRKQGGKHKDSPHDINPNISNTTKNPMELSS